MTITSPAKLEVPMLDTTSEVQELWDELMASVGGVLRSGQFILGPNVQALEEEVARSVGLPHAVAVNSGTDALVIALRALGVGPGDEVVTTPFTFFATAEAVSAVGATPVFVDISPRTYDMCVDATAAAITSRTRALLPVHLYGHAADMAGLRELADAHSIPLVEDVAQAFGGTDRGQALGGIGDVGALSFFPSKNLGGFGDGGMLVTANADVAERARMLRAHGSRRKYHNEMIGLNSRLDELQAAMLRVKLRRLDAMNSDRRRVAQRYLDALSGTPGLSLPATRPGVQHVYHQFTVRVADGHRDRVVSELHERGISTMVYYPVPVHRLPVYADLGARDLPHAEQAAREVLSLPIWPGMPEDVQGRVVEALHLAVRH